MNPEKYPLDFDALQKGDYINSDYIQKITGHEPETKEYSFAVMQLINQIESRLDVVCKQSGNGIEILTDEKAVFYIRKQNIAANRKKKSNCGDCKHLWMLLTYLLMGRNGSLQS